MKSLFKHITILVLLTTNLPARAQSYDALHIANKLFNSGRIQDCIDTLEPNIGNGFRKEERAECYHLLAQAYQSINQMEKAHYYVRKMLKLKPDYQKFSSIDPLDFARLVNQYSVTPKFYGGLMFGINTSTVDLVKSHSAYQSTQRYLPATGYQLGFSCDYRIKPLISLKADFLAMGIGIHQQIDSVGGWQQDYSEQEKFAGLRLNVIKYFHLGSKFQFFAGVGWGTAYMYEANVLVESRNLETNSLQQFTQNPVSMRNRWQQNVNGVAGFSFQLPTGVLGLEAGFLQFLHTSVNPDKLFEDLNFNLNNHYVNDEIKLKLTTVSLSYKIPLIWGIKLKK